MLESIVVFQSNWASCLKVLCLSNQIGVRVGKSCVFRMKLGLMLESAVFSNQIGGPSLQKWGTKKQNGRTTKKQGAKGEQKIRGDNKLRPDRGDKKKAWFFVVF